MAPTGLLITSSTETDAIISWNQIVSSPENGYSSITDYKVFWDQGASSPDYDELVSTTSNSSSYSITGLTGGTTYNFKVAGVNDLGTGT